MSVYICSDIHGQYSLYKKMLEAVSFSENDTLYIIGDLIDRGPESMPLVQDVMARENVVCLLGNHELMMYDHLNKNYDRDYWCHGGNGGTVTKRAFRKLPGPDQNAVIKWIKSLYLQIEITENGGTFLLSHSAFLGNCGTVRWRDADEQVVFDTVWNSPWRIWEYIPLSDYALDGRMHIIGHVPVQYIREKEWPGGNMPDMPSAYVDETNHIINIDTGCAGIPTGSSSDGFALCCMNLTAYAGGGAETAFSYFS